MQAHRTSAGPTSGKTPACLSSQSGSRDEASVEASHQEEETKTILGGCRKLAEAGSEWWKRYICSDKVFVPILYF